MADETRWIREVCRTRAGRAVKWSDWTKRKGKDERVKETYVVR